LSIPSQRTKYNSNSDVTDNLDIILLLGGVATVAAHDAARNSASPLGAFVRAIRATAVVISNRAPQPCAGKFPAFFIVSTVERAIIAAIWPAANFSKYYLQAAAILRLTSPRPES
jgi:hypothetical protein